MLWIVTAFLSIYILKIMEANKLAIEAYQKFVPNQLKSSVCVFSYNIPNNHDELKIMETSTAKCSRDCDHSHLDGIFPINDTIS